MEIKRREFLKTSALVIAGAAAAASGVPVAAYGDKWTSKLKTLEPHQGETLLKMCRQIFPHDQLDDAYYVKVVTDLDAEANASVEVAKLLGEGVERINGAKAGSFASLPPEQQVDLLASIQTTAFFQKVRSTELVSLYGNPGVWKRFGYEGPSSQFGGYVHRGFNDLKWLPDPPESASPPAA